MTDTVHDLAVQMTAISGKVDVVIARMEAGDRQSAQLVALVKDQLTFMAADTGELKAVVRELSQRTEIGLSALRVEMETRLHSHSTEIETLKLWRARLAGMAVAVSFLASALTASLVKWIGA